MDDIHLIPISRYAKAHGLSPVTVQQKCQRGTLPTAVKIGERWFVHPDAPYPDSRVKTGKYRNWRRKPNQDPDSTDGPG